MRHSIEEIIENNIDKIDIIKLKLLMKYNDSKNRKNGKKGKTEFKS